MPDYMRKWGHDFVRLVRQPKIVIRKLCETCGEPTEHTLNSARIKADIIEHFDLCLVQNIDSLPQMDSYKNVVCRSGGMVIEQNDTHRYDEWLRQCPAVISTNSLLHGIATHANDNCFLIPNGCDLEVFKPRDRKQGKFTVGFAGNIYGPGLHYKGFKFFSQAVIDMFDEVNHIKRLHSHSQIPHEKMPDFYHSIDCLVIPSLGEGCSNVTMEALACGIPVLTTPVGFHGERLTHMEDVLFIARDADDRDWETSLT